MATVQVGEISFDPVYLTVGNLARCGEGEYRAALQWVAAERATRAERAASNEARVREIAASMQSEMRERHAAQSEWATRNVPGL